MKLYRAVAATAIFWTLSAGAFAARPEFRGAWVTCWTAGFLTPQEADRTIIAAKDANLNALFIEVRKTADAFYNSSIEPRGSEISSLPDYDPLSYVVQKAHEQGIEVHAWAVVFRVWTGKSPPKDPKHVVNVHPDWLSRNFAGQAASADGIWLDPGNPEVQDYTAKVLMEIVSNYDIDGLHLDYIRYPGRDWGYSEVAVARFNQEKGRSGKPDPNDPAWLDWRREQVTAFVRRVYREATALKPKIKVTASTIPWGDCPSDFTRASPYAQALQDWRAWMKEGLLDANVIMNYKDESSAKGAAQFRKWIEAACQWSYGRHAYIGQTFSGDVDRVVRQILACRERDVAGVSGFPFNETQWRPKLVRALREKVFQEAAEIPEMPWKMDAARRASREALNQAIRYATSEVNLDKAIELLSRAVALDPSYTEAHFRLGRCYLRKKMYELAATEFRRVLQLDPRHKAAGEQLDIANAQLAGAAKRAGEPSVGGSATSN